MNRNVRHSFLRSSRHRRGVALMMVLSVVAVASILSWAMLSAAAMRAQIDVNATDAVEANFLAESGVSYALYYLRYPARSPVALVSGAHDTHYPGQTGLQLWSDARGTVDITVTNTAKYTYKVRSSSLVDGTRRTVEADVQQIMQGYQITSAGGFNGPFTIPATMHIDGPVVNKGLVQGQVSHITNAPGFAAAGSGVDVVPLAANIGLLTETGTAATGTGLATDRTYTYNGQTYVAEKAPSTILLFQYTNRPALNPLNVWYSDTAVTLNNASFTGVLVVRNGNLNVVGTNVITAPDGMPAIVVAKQVDMKHSVQAAKLTANGVVWVGQKFITSGSNRTDGLIKVNGALLMGGAAPSIDSFISPITVKYTASALGVTELSTVKTVADVKVLRWESVE